MSQAAVSVNLGLQLAVTAGLGLVMTMSHTLGLAGISRLLKLEDRCIHPHKLDMETLLVVGSMGILIAALHIAEIVAYALFYLAVGALPNFEDALFHSATAYSTLGLADGSFPRDWRLAGAFEALTGFILIGWSTAYMVSTMQRMRA